MPRGQYDRAAAAKKRRKPFDEIAVGKMSVVVNPMQEKSITSRQEKFCKLYATENYTQTQCVLMAGYSTNIRAAYQQASKLLDGKSYPHVVERIRELRQELVGHYEVTFDNHVRRMAEIRDAALASGNFASAVAAEKARGQAAGLYITRQEILIGKIDQMSKDEVMAEINRIMSEYPILIEATAPTIDMEELNERSTVVEQVKEKHRKQG